MTPASEFLLIAATIVGTGAGIAIGVLVSRQNPPKSKSLDCMLCPACGRQASEEDWDGEEVKFWCGTCKYLWEPQAQFEIRVAAEHEVEWMVRVDDAVLEREFRLLAEAVERRAHADEFARQATLQSTCQHPRTWHPPELVGRVLCRDCGLHIQPVVWDRSVGSISGASNSPEWFEEVLVEIGGMRRRVKCLWS